MTSDIDGTTVAVTRRVRWGVLGALAVFGVVAAAGPVGSQVWRGKEETREGVVWVLNPAEPSSPRPRSSGARGEKATTRFSSV